MFLIMRRPLFRPLISMFLIMIGHAYNCHGRHLDFLINCLATTGMTGVSNAITRSYTLSPGHVLLETCLCNIDWSRSAS